MPHFRYLAIAATAMKGLTVNTGIFTTVLNHLLSFLVMGRLQPIVLKCCLSTTSPDIPSGKTSDASVPKISKKGDADLRYGLYQAALIASYHNKHFVGLYNRIL
jgi:hypothetical protein